MEECKALPSTLTSATSPNFIWRHPTSTMSSGSSSPLHQGLTLVRFSAQFKRFLWDRAAFRGCVGVVQEVSGGFRGVSGFVLCQKRLKLS